MEERQLRERQRCRVGIKPVPALSREAQKIMKAAFRALMRGVSAGEPYRFSQEMLAVLRKEAQIRQSINSRRQEARVLVGFEFVRNGELDLNLLAPIAGTADPGLPDREGTFSCIAAPFQPLNIAGAADGTTHIKMASIAAELDLERGILRMVNLMSAILPWQGTAATVLEQCHTIKVNSSKPVFLAVGMVYYRERSGVMFALKNGRFNPLVIIKAANNKTSWL